MVFLLTEKGETTAYLWKGKKEDVELQSAQTVPNKIMEHILLQTMLRSMENKEEMDDS